METGDGDAEKRPNKEGGADYGRERVRHVGHREEERMRRSASVCREPGRSDCWLGGT